MGVADLYRDAGDGDVILLAGGENLAQTWFDMHLTLVDPAHAEQLLGGARRASAGSREKRSRRTLRGRQPFPYILSPDDFRHVRPRVMYNSMGGWPLAHYLPPQQESIAQSLRKASYVSVRDSESASILRDLDPQLPECVAPDCAFLLPELLPREELGRRASPEVRRLVARSEGYICFQCNRWHGEPNRDELKGQLLALARESGLDLVLVPLNRLYSFEDDVFLASLAAALGPRVHLLPQSATVYDIAYVLAGARLFCGTSLHGVITAFTYGSPFVPLDTRDPKLRFNVASWGLGERFPCAAAAELASHGLRCLSLDRGAVGAESARLRAAARANMQRLAKRILTA
jgi:hypothetical protein